MRYGISDRNSGKYVAGEIIMVLIHSTIYTHSILKQYCTLCFYDQSFPRILYVATAPEG